MITKNSITWKFIPLKEYTAPPLFSKIRTNLFSFSECSHYKTTIRQNDLLKAVDWKPISNAFNEAINGSNGLLSKNPACVCVGLFGSAAHTLRTWASERNIPLLEPPSMEQLLEPSSKDWSFPQGDLEIPLVIPSLEQCFLRHYRGLAWVEQMMEVVWRQQRQLIIGSDLWAWEYLERALQIDAICPTPLISACLTVEQLRSWLPLTLKEKNVRCVVEGEDCFALDSKKGAKFLDELIRKSQGCMTLAWILWHLLLEENNSKIVDGIIELCPKQVLSKTSNVLESRPNLYVLHVLLIHSHLSTKGFLTLLPFPRTQIRKALVELMTQGFVIENQDVWEVAPKKYFDVVQQLKNREFWVVGFGNESRI